MPRERFAAELPGTTSTWLQEIAARFENAWQAGQQPALADYLPSDAPRRQKALVELAGLDMHHRLRNGQSTRVENYLERFPELANDPGAVLELIRREHAVRQGLEPKSTTAEYVQRFPQYSDQLHSLLDPCPTQSMAEAQPALETGPDLDAGGEDQAPVRLGRYRVDRLLGQGGFGVVYKGYDEELERAVAIKVPRRDRLSRPEDAEAYLAEARVVARLEHPHIVPVLDVGRTADGVCFVVSRFIAGSNLAQQMTAGRLSAGAAAGLAATVAEALHYAHTRGLVHRDVKPANILLDQAGAPYLADFGLALKEQDYGQTSGICGTPAYMSPEQANGEGHRVDGRSDIFSLGVVLYELLTGRRPFHGDSTAILRQIATHEPRPPRQVDDTIARELERICLKALAKRASERYTTAKDLAEDLRHFLETATDSHASRNNGSILAVAAVGAAVSSAPTPTVMPSPFSDSRPPLRIVPKGLRSFDAHDADFFLELLSGPRDRDGLPDTVRFWKTRVEETDADNTFAVGLIYGPSGCGKSSMIKAGLLPRLTSNVAAIYVEATGQDTETRLLNGLRKRFPGLTGNLGLKETLAALRRGDGAAPDQKVLLILDQFEQWLHARKAEKNTELVQALRQCDGARLQCLVLVRDDFWLAVSRFMKELEIRLIDGQNSALVDLFDTDHARKVLLAFGRAFGKLPENPRQISAEHKQFVEQAVRGLAQEGKVVCVRLALFAEMMKGKAWAPATLKEMGGAEGVGVTFLEETFSAATAPPEHRYHQNAARAVLKALLPEAGTDIKGHMRAHADLLAASGYQNRPEDCDDLLRILDSEIRLITPTDPEGVERVGVPALAGLPEDRLKPGLQHEPGVGVPAFAGLPEDRLKPVLQHGEAKYYQLTHDYLVPSLREWLTRKQKETRRGRAELLLADRAGVWNARPENRQLPSLPQWWQIRWLTRKKNWTPPESKMMHKAARYHLVRGVLAVTLMFMLLLAGWEGFGRIKAYNLAGRLLDAKTADVPRLVDEMAGYRRWVNPLLHMAAAQAERDNDPVRQLHASLALAPVEPAQREYLLKRLLEAEAQQVIAIRQVLRPYQADLSARLWQVLEDRQADLDQRFRAACALAEYTPRDGRWAGVSADVAARLATQDSTVLGAWAEALQPVGQSLLPPLAAFLQDEKRSSSERSAMAHLCKIFATDKKDATAPLEKVLHQQSKGGDTALARRQANVGVALVVMGHGDQVWPHLKQSTDPTLRSYLIDRLAAGGVDPKVLLARFREEQDSSIRRALLLSLGAYGLDRLPEVERRNFLPYLERLYRDDPDAGIHGAAEWVLRQWLTEQAFQQIAKSLPRGKFEFEDKEWCLTKTGHTMVFVPRPPGEISYSEHPTRRERIANNYAIAATEVTVAQYTRFGPDQRKFKQYASARDCPMMEVSWHDAAAYCNWLSKEEGIPEDQWCYEPAGKGEYKPAANHLQRLGYRLATGGEWEYACRVGATTNYAFGEAAELLVKYGWHSPNALSQSHPVGRLKPNDLGLFDMQGNAWEWIDDWFDAGQTRRVGRGGGWYDGPGGCRVAARNLYEPSYRNSDLGMRVVRIVTGSRGK